MSHNTFGHLFRFTTFGESHGPEIGCIVDGTPPNIPLSEADIQPYLDKRRPGQSRHTTQRQESDKINILSGVFNNLTTGTPIGLSIQNQDARSKDYTEIAEKFRPGHADFTYSQKYGFRDYRGGGRASARETAMRVAVGAIARKILGKNIGIQGALISMGNLKINYDKWDWKYVEKNPFFCPDPGLVPTLETYLDNIRKQGSSIGAIDIVLLELISPDAVKAVEIGSGMGSSELSGEENADEICIDSQGKPKFQSNHSGGILGGISTGQDIICRFAVKPTSSILAKLNTIDVHNNETSITTKGRHDPCVGIRAVPIGEAMLACVLADQMLRHRAQCS